MIIFGTMLLVLFSIWSLFSEERGVDWSNPPTETVIISAAKVRVIDGDTFEVAGERLRLKGWDTPEKFGNEECPQERMLGELASNKARNLVSRSSQFMYVPVGMDSYGRTLSHWALDGQDYGQALSESGLAKRWIFQQEDKPDWCKG